MLKPLKPKPTLSRMSYIQALGSCAGLAGIKIGRMKGLGSPQKQEKYHASREKHELIKYELACGGERGRQTEGAAGGSI